MSIKVGDSVLYVPHGVYARQQDRNGNFPWVIGKKTGKKVRNKHGQSEDEVAELTNGEMAKALTHVRKQAPHRKELEASKLVFLRPNASWDAKVLATRVFDGKQVCDLSISDPTTGSTITSYSVLVDETTRLPDTCHEKRHLGATVAAGTEAPEPWLQDDVRVPSMPPAETAPEPKK